MSTIHATSTAAPTTDRPVIWRHGVAASIAAAVVTTTLAAVAHAGGVSFADKTGASIPLLGFTQLTLVFSLIGVAIAAVLARRVHRPRSTFVRTTVALTALSVVPDFTVGFDTASAFTLASLHCVAAAIVVPVVASRLAARR